MRLGIFGGTFDPVHLGHIWMARAAREELCLDKLYMIPASDPPHKPNSNRLSGSARMRMLDIALKNEDRILPSDIELKRPGKSYTYDTVLQFKRQYRGAEIFLIVGGDMLACFDKWRDPAGILGLATLVAVTRPDEQRDMQMLAKTIEECFGGRVIVSSFIGPDISSTEVRRRMYEAEPVDTLVPRGVELYMYENAVYMPESIIEIRSSLSGILKSKRLAHTMLTVREAVRLAARYGVDTQKARLAALLHDCIKLPNRELIAYADEHCYDISDEERRSPYLIHARLGAVIAMEKYGVTDSDVLRAIENHTLGRVGMSLLDKVIYVADKIEPSRDFEGIDDIRTIAYEDINKAMLLVMQHSADYTVASGRAVNPSTKTVMEYIKNEINLTEGSI